MKFTLSKNILIGLFGAAFGIIFPVISWSILFYDLGLYPTLDSIYIIHDTNILLWIIDLAPLILGLCCFFLGVRVNENASRLNTIIKNRESNYKELVGFAENIGKGNFSEEYKSAGEDDTLGLALNQMKDDLIINHNKEREENWLALGREKISALIRANSDIDGLTYALLTEIISYIEIVQGAVFLTENDDEKLSLKERKSVVELKMYAHYAYGRKKYTTNSYRLGEGLIGEAAIEQLTIHRTEIPDNYLTVTSGLIKDSKPKAILIVPFVTEEKLQGVIELSSFKKFTDIQIQLIEEIAEIVARALYNLKINEQTTLHLKESQEMTSELQEQQSMLQENALEMQNKQEEIQKANKELEVQMTAVENAQKRQYLLLENSSEVITIYSEDGEITYESPSITKILGYTQDEMLGINIFDNKSPSLTLIKLRELLLYTKENPTDKKVIEVAYAKKTGEEVSLEVVGINLLDEPAINGIVFNFRDITERLLAEKAQIMRGKMQSLSENSEDIIVRLDLEGYFQYANPMLEKITGVETVDINTKKYTEAGFNDNLVESWSAIIDEVKAEQKLLVKEMIFPFEGSDKIMLVNAIPEFSVEEELETILLVSHDITQRKAQEVILEATNKKITDSINYAKRIQNAIIPSIEEIKKDLSETFMFYKPKDVVSGDFPYYFKKGKYAYYAAIDCTGHGVPGAMMSLIGYLLLNDILNGTEILSPADVLLKLHQGVVRTLKQDDLENKAADGMDMALCRIDLETNEIQYSGAHRPLYHLRNGELTQYKGDKYPIGGNQYKGKNNYQNHLVEIQDGDSVFFFSDGFPDQFGGPEQLKYGPKRIRTSIVENEGVDFDKYHDIFSDDYHEWMGDTKQIDDVLLIGIKF